MLVVGIGGTDAHHGGVSSVEGLVGMEPWWGTVARSLDIERLRIGVLGVADIASGHCGHHAGVENGLVQLPEERIATRLGVTERAAQDVGPMGQGELNAFNDLCVTAIAGLVHDLHRHNLGSRGDTRLGSCVALSGHDAGTVGAMHVIIHRVVVVVDDIIAVMRELRTSIPHAARNVNVVVVHTRIEYGYDDTIASISCRAVVVPHSRSVHFVHMPGIVLRFHRI